MGKAKTSKRGGASSTPYDRPSKNKAAAAAANNVFKFTKDLGQHILRNPGIAQASKLSYIFLETFTLHAVFSDLEFT